MNTTKFKLELGTIPESIPELTPVEYKLTLTDLGLDSEAKTNPESAPKTELELKSDSEAKTNPESEKELKPESEPKTKPESETVLNSIKDSLDVDESIKTLTQSINYHDNVDYSCSLPHFIEDKPKIKKVIFNFETIIPNEPITPQKDIPQLDSDNSYCACILSKPNSD